MNKPAPWAWSPERVAAPWRAMARDTVSLVPMWWANSGGTWDVARRAQWVIENTVTFSRDPVGVRAITAAVSRLNSNADLLAGETQCTVTAVMDCTTSPRTNAAALSVWNNDTVLLWRVQSSRTMRILLDTAGGTADTTSEVNSLASTGLTVATFRYTGSRVEQFFNGQKSANSSTAGSGAIDAAHPSDKYSIGAQGPSALEMDQPFYLLHIARRAYSDQEIGLLHADVFGLVREAAAVPIHALTLTTPSGGGSIAAIAAYYHRQRAA